MRVVVVLVTCLAFSVMPTLQGDADQVAVASALDRYERTATTGSLTFSGVDALTRALDVAVPRWVGQAPPADRERREKLAALFVLDLSWAELRGSAPFGLHRLAMIEWGCKRLRQQPPSDFSRVWMWVSHALLQPSTAAYGDVPSVVKEHLAHARKLFPADTRLRLAELLYRPAAANLSNRPGANASKLARTGLGRIALTGQLNVPAYTLDVTLKDLQPVIDDVDVGPEALAHVGIIKFHKKELAESIADLTAAANRSADPFVQNLAWLFVGLAYDARRMDSDAITAYEEAVIAVPTAKTSAMALASHWFVAGRREDAALILDRAFSVDVPTLDPWQNPADMLRFVQGWMARLHSAVGHPVQNETAASVTFVADATDSASRRDNLIRYADWQPVRQELPAFRATGSAVLVDVSVRRGNRPVEDLGPADFEVLDNGIPQLVESISEEPLPLDLTMVVDYYDAASTEETNPLGPSYMDGQRDALRVDVPSIARLLGRGDRIRVIFVENAPVETMHLQSAGADPPQPPGARYGRSSYRRNSAIYDSVALALMEATPMGRRHVVLTFSEGADDASVLTKERLIALASKSDAVLHLSKRLFNRSGYPTLLWEPDSQALSQVASITGGTLLNSLGGSKYDDVRRIFDRLRQSYVLRYQPSGMTAPGWHHIQVRLKRTGEFNIQARKGYWGG